jgi:hypothetical protein
MDGWEKRSFAHLSPSNPLRTMSVDSQKRVLAFLVVYAERLDLGQADDELTRVRQVTKDALQLSKELNKFLAGGMSILPWSQLVSQNDSSALSAALETYARKLTAALDFLFERKSLSKTVAAEFLFWASETVRQETGHFHDEYLAELLQTLFPPDSPEALSGDGIRKKRERSPAMFASSKRRLAKQPRSDLSKSAIQAPIAGNALGVKSKTARG